MQIFTKTDVGLVRQENEDALYSAKLSDGTAFAVVCDGMGGANAGNIASNMAIEYIGKYLKNSYSKSLSNEMKSDLLQNAIKSANIEIYESALKNKDLRGMGTTTVAVLAGKDNAIIAHVGDSRAYKIADDLIQLTSDHTVVQTLVESGKLTASEAKNHPEKNVLTRALGVEENIISDVSVIPFSEGEKLLICTDGLYNYVDTDVIYDICKTKNASEIPSALTELAIENGGGDNITVVIIENS